MASVLTRSRGRARAEDGEAAGTGRPNAPGLRAVPSGRADAVAETESKAAEPLPDIGEARDEAPMPSEPAAAEIGALAGGAKPKRGRGRQLLVAGVLAAAIAGGAYYGFDWWTEGRFFVSTDDAYVAADTAVLAPKVAGYVKAVPVADNARVTAGTPLVELDDSDYRIALRQAEAQVAEQKAALARIGEQVNAGQAGVTQAEAELASARAAAANASKEHDRATALVGKAAGTQQAVDTTQATLLQANAAVDAAQAGLVTAQANVSVLEAQKVEAERLLDRYGLAVDKAQLDLDHTIVRAPFDGVVGNRAVEPGEYVTPGLRLMALVPLQDVYVDANFKETQLADIHPGQTADISVDAFPDRVIHGTVASVAPASGAVFSLLPPDNATGNFTKVVQRLAVRIRVPESVAAESVVRPGMSVVVAVDTRTGPAETAAR